MKILTQIQNGALRGRGAEESKAPKMWEIMAAYEGGNRYMFRTRDLVRTLRKLAEHEELVSVAIKPLFNNNGAWIWIGKEYLQFLLDGNEIPITWTLHPDLNCAHGTGSTSLKLLLGE